MRKPVNQMYENVDTMDMMNPKETMDDSYRILIGLQDVYLPLQKEDGLKWLDEVPQD